MVDIESPKPIFRKIIATPQNFIPSSPDLEVVGAFNPGATSIEMPNRLENILMVRIAETHTEREDGKIPLPYFEIPNAKNKYLNINFDIYEKKDLRKIGKKEVNIANSTDRLRHISHSRIKRFDENWNVKKVEQTPTIYPAYEYERFGMEDFRITKMSDGRYIITYVVPHRKEWVSTPFIVTRDFENFERMDEDDTPRSNLIGKDVALFSERLPSPSSSEIIDKGEDLYAALFRPDLHSKLSTPGIGVIYSPDLKHWGQFYRLTEEGKITGTGSPPLKMGNKWVAIYHEIYQINKEKSEYKSKLFSVDGKHPWKDFKTSEVLSTREDFREILPKNGFVSPVVYPIGFIERDGASDIIYGIDDTWTVVERYHTEDLLKFIERS